MSTTDNILRDMCRSVCESIEQIELGGNLAKCDYCGEVHDICDIQGDYTEEWPDSFAHIEDGETVYRCPNCKHELPDSPEPYGAYDWLDGILDIEYTVNSQMEYLGATVCLAWGGPSIYLDTRNHEIRGYWWGDHYTISGVACAMIDEAIEEHFRCTIAV